MRPQHKPITHGIFFTMSNVAGMISQVIYEEKVDQNKFMKKKKKFLKSIVCTYEHLRECAINKIIRRNITARIYESLGIQELEI
jgi:hypothetical protein